ncbi:MAG: ABC transporter ATP-binding protein [Phycisphaeraceae bacterium]|nr:ABC transporter ATP-binding protein [Phycisphaeraceae bacterium]
MTHAAPASSPASQVAASPAVRMVNLTKRIDDRPILAGLTLTISRGRFVALAGANGAGKTTLLHILATLTNRTSGDLELLGRPVTHGSASAHLRAKIGLIGHQALLYRDLTARENLIFFARLYNVTDPPGRAAQLLSRMGLLDRADDPAATLSRGMLQRLGIARAVVHDPELLLADEPFAGLDAPSTAAIESLLTELHQSGKTILMSNHDVPQSLRLAQHVIALRRGRCVMDQPTTSGGGAEVTPAQLLEAIR